MKSNAITLICMTLMAFISSASFAGEKCQEVKHQSFLKKYCKNLSISKQSGYASSYVYRGLVASRAIFDGNTVVPSFLDLKYELCESNSLFLDLGFTAIGSARKAFGLDVKDKAHNEFSVDLGWQHTSLSKKLTTSFYWGMDHGGLPGLYAKLGENKPHSLVQEFSLAFNYALSDRWNVGIINSYSFYGMTGWWFEPYINYRQKFNEWIGINATMGMSATAGYFGNYQANANGAQAWFIKTEFPIPLHYKTWELSPFVSFNWAGSGAMKANELFPIQDRPYKNFAVVAGVSLTYTF